MCTGRIDLSYILRVLSKRADGVFIVGCHLNECNYITHGNFHALSTVYICKKIMNHIGLNPDRLRIQFMSGGEGILFTEVMNEFGRKIKEMGPLGKAEGIDSHVLKLKIEAALSLVPYIRLVERERMRISVRSKDAYEKFFTSEEFDRLFQTLIADKLAIGEITLLLGEGPLSTGEIAEKIGLTSSEASRHIISSSRQGLVRYDEKHKRFALA
jgi:F420-non-reducing hydrogenase iron-sulfur subunit